MAKGKFTSNNNGRINLNQPLRQKSPPSSELSKLHASRRVVLGIEDVSERNVPKKKVELQQKKCVA